MKIRKEQMAAFAADRRRQFVDRVIAHLEQAYPEAVWDADPNDLRRRIDQTIDRAMSYGIAIEKDVGAFIDFTYDLGESFDTEPENEWARSILLRGDLDGSAKIAELRHLLYRP